MATPKDGREITPETISFREVARIAGWTNKPPWQIGFEHSICSCMFPMGIAPSRRHAQLLCDSLNDRYANQPMMPRFGWLPASDFPAHKSVNLERSIRQALTGGLRGEAAITIHSIAKEAEAVNETVADSFGPDIVSCDEPQPDRFYVFVRLFPGLLASSPWKDWVVLPNGDVDAAMLSDARKWARENWEQVDAAYRKLSRLRMGTPQRREDEESEAVERLLAEMLDRANRQTIKAKLAGTSGLQSEPTNAQGAVTPKRRGRKKADYKTEQAESNIAAAWRRAHEAGADRRDFARDNKIKLADLVRLLNRVSKRNTRAE